MKEAVMACLVVLSKYSPEIQDNHNKASANIAKTTRDVNQVPS
jgi:hypothetical protein